MLESEEVLKLAKLSRLSISEEEIPAVKGHLDKMLNHLEALKATLAQDPRPRYHDDPERVYGMPFLHFDVRFKVSEKTLTVVEIVNN